MFPASSPSRTVDSLAQAVVAHQAPDEMPYYPELRDAFFARGGRRLAARGNPTGFGEAVTAVVLTVLRGLVAGTLADVARPWWQRVWKQAWQRLRRTPRVEAKTELPALTEGQLPLVREAVHHHGSRAGLPDTQVDELAEAIVAALTAHAGETSTG